MTTDLTLQVNGVKDAVKYLNKVEPGFRKAYIANMKEVAKPMTDAMKSNYDDNRFPSGTQRNWSPGGRQVFPLSASKAVRGVGVRVNNKKQGAAFSVMQKNPAAAIFDIAGRANVNPLGTAFSNKFGRSASRVIWPVFEAKIVALTTEVQKVVDGVMAEANKNLKVF
jgi:hypothetical protein